MYSRGSFVGVVFIGMFVFIQGFRIVQLKSQLLLVLVTLKALFFYYLFVM